MARVGPQAAAAPRGLHPAPPQAGSAGSLLTALYVETSFLVGAFFEGDTALLRELARHRCAASALTFAEALRAAARTPGGGERQRAAIESFRKSCDVLAIDDAVLERAGERFPHEPVRTLDAIHLATALILRGARPVRLASTDARLRRNAAALGFELIPD